MKKVKKIALVLGTIFILLGAIIFTIGLLNPENAGIQIETTPQAIVFINGEQVGRTPFTGTYKPGTVTVKLVPESPDRPLEPYETNIDLVSGIQTAILREFGQFSADSSGAIVSFAKETSGATSISVISEPDASQVLIDGAASGFTPYKKVNVSEGDHIVEVVHPGYYSKNLTVKSEKGYNLTVSIKLAVNPAEVETEPQVTEEKEEVKEMIKILATPTGFLRVRSGPSLAEEEVGRVDPDTEFAIIEKTEDETWYKIEYEDGKEGWISAEYTEAVTE